MFINVLKVMIPLTLTFLIGIFFAPSLARLMYRHRMWKRSGRGDQSQNPDISQDFSLIHDTERELSTPRVGGVLIWLSVVSTAIIMWLLSYFFDTGITAKFDFLSRSQTWLPLFGLIVASCVGLGDDLLQIFGKGKVFVDGLSRWQRVGAVTLMALVGALWFFFQLDISSIAVPFAGSVDLAWFFIPFFIMVVLATFSGSVIDGLDGLAGGVLMHAFTAYAIIAFAQSQFDLAAFASAVAGGILAFLWFNIPPARFYMGETGVMGLTVTLALIAFFTDQVLLLPVIAFPLVITSASVIIQKLSRRFRGKRVFKVAPLHHHFQALGWPAEKVTMRYWIISIVCSVSGVIIALVG